MAAAQEHPGRRPTWAVVIPAYNEADRIGDALRTLREQTEPADEIVVVDDGSEDDLDAAVAGYRDMVEVIRQPNGGLAAARNTGGAAIDSEWVLFLDADDWLAPNFLAALRDTVAAAPALDIVATDALGIDDAHGEVLYRHYERVGFAHREQRLAILDHNFTLTGVSVRRRAWEDAGRFDETMQVCEDWECWSRMILRGSRAGLAADTVLYRRHHGGNMSSDRFVMLAGRLEVLRRSLARDDLSRRERATARRSVRTNRRALRMLEARRILAAWVAQAYLDAGSAPVHEAPAPADHAVPDRSAATRLLAKRGTPLRLRGALLIGLLHPRLAARLLRDRPRYALSAEPVDVSAGSVGEARTGG